MTAVVTEDVKSVKLDELAKCSGATVAPLMEDVGVADATETVPDLVTLENQKRDCQKNIHQQESFWSYLCFRSCTDCCYYCHCCNSCSTSDTFFCCVACENVECSGACCGECCSGCGQCCADCMTAAEPCTMACDGLGACCSAC